jgi:hypothetical protein
MPFAADRSTQKLPILLFEAAGSGTPEWYNFDAIRQFPQQL